MARYPLPFGKYLLLERINVGGMAEVFKTKTFGVHGFQRIGALKRILPNIMEDEDFIKMFIDEARIATHLEHGNIVRILELGQHGHSLYIAMEYVPGRDLRELLARCRKRGIEFPINLVAYIISEACKGLDYAHRCTDLVGNPMDIIHRDVSPQNILLSWDGAVKVCDFGIAKAQNRASQTQAGVLKGKFAYMSPEQVRGKPIDHRSDIFGLGVIAHEMVSGQRLFLGESDFSTLQRVRKADVRPLTLERDDVEEEFSDAILGALARDPKQRYATAQDFANAIQPWLIEGRRITSAADLEAFMQKLYAAEIAADREKMQRFLEMEAPEGLAEAATKEVHAENSSTDEIVLPGPSDEDKTVIFDVNAAGLESVNTDGERTMLVDPVSDPMPGDEDKTMIADPAFFAMGPGGASLEGLNFDDHETQEVSSPTAATLPSVPSMPPMPAQAPPPPTMPPAPRSEGSKKNPMMIGAAAIVVILAAVAAAMMTGGDEAPATAANPAKTVAAAPTPDAGPPAPVDAGLVDAGAKPSKPATKPSKPAAKPRKPATKRRKPASKPSKPATEPSKPAAASGPKDCKLMVRTTPDGAMVALGARSIGRAPVTKKNLNCETNHRLTVNAKGYETRRFNLEFKHNKVLVKNVTLTKATQGAKKPAAKPAASGGGAAVRLKIGTPGIRAQVRVNGRAVGPAPVVARAPALTPGKHELELIVDGKTHTYTVILPPGVAKPRLIIRKLGQKVDGAVKAIPR